MGPYTGSEDPQMRMLSEQQWSWLAQRLREPAELRLLCTSVQLVADEHGWEGWYTLPAERERLYRLLAETRAGGVIALSGDRHAAEISALNTANDGRGPGYRLYDVTASAMNQSRRWRNERNSQRVGDLYSGPNFGSLDIDWKADEPMVTVSIHDVSRAPMLVEQIPLATLQPPAAPEVAGTARLERIALGSCNQQSRPTPIWEDVLATDPQLFLFLGDNIYGDTKDADALRACYAELGAQPGFAKLRAQVPVPGDLGRPRLWDERLRQGASAARRVAADLARLLRGAGGLAAPNSRRRVWVLATRAAWRARPGNPAGSALSPRPLGPPRWAPQSRRRTARRLRAQHGPERHDPRRSAVVLARGAAASPRSPAADRDVATVSVGGPRVGVLDDDAE